MNGQMTAATAWLDEQRSIIRISSTILRVSGKLRSRLGLMLLIMTLSTVSGYSIAVVRTTLFEAKIAVVVGPTLVGCPTNELPNFPLYKGLFVSLFDYEPVLQATIDSLHLPYDPKVLIRKVTLEQDNVGRIVVSVWDTDQFVAESIVNTLVSNAVAEFDQIEQLSGPLERICNRIGAKYSPQLNHHPVTREMMISFTTLVSFFTGFLLAICLGATVPVASIYSRSSTAQLR